MTVNIFSLGEGDKCPIIGITSRQNATQGI